MSGDKVKVAINGYGVIGKRVADAVALQANMELVGVADVASDYRIRVAIERGYAVFASDLTARLEMQASGIQVAGSLDDLLGMVDVVADCAPKKLAAGNKDRYSAAKVKGIWQGGETSHQGPDAQTVIPDLDITTLAGAGPYNLSPIHFAMVETTRPVGLDELRDALWDEPRVAFVRAADGLVALNSVIELMRDLGRPRGDMWEVAVWEDALASDGREVYLTYQVHNESIVVPETVDCIRALTGIEPDGAASMAKTDRSLGVTKSFFPATTKPIADSR